MSRRPPERSPAREDLIKEKHDLVAAIKASALAPVIEAMAIAAMKEATHMAGWSETWEDQSPMTKDVWRLTAYAAMQAAKAMKQERAA